jgi:hypothetical protein
MGELIFPEVAWRGPFAEYRLAMHETTEASDVAHFQTFWGSVAVRLGRRLHWKAGSIIYPNAYLGFHGPTADNKTTSQKRILHCDLLEGCNIPIVQGVGSAEGLGDALEEAGGGPYLFYWEEFCEVYSISRYDGGALMAHLTQTFDCPAVWERKFRKKPISVANPTPTVLTGTTGEWFWKNAKADDFHGGFLNRFFWLAGQRKPPIPNPEEVNGKIIHDIKERLRQLDEVKTEAAAYWSAEANELWKTYYTRTRSIQHDGLLGSALKRNHVYVRKLCLIYAWLEATYPIVTRDQLQAAIAVIDYGEQCTRQLIEMQTQGDEKRREIEHRVLEWVQKHDGERIRLLHQRLFRLKGDAETLYRVLRSLVQTDQIQIKENRIYLTENTYDKCTGGQK